ncbi:hypothetical protein GDO86_010893 [Hymenochirus boettgeri]|uniref:Solute carrier family 7 member 13 n=1 Tax=Hymenochirus boettgeri TaxID=247094 RepID=A0A8T2JH15_9PIPI|nr:hypothetical protein GDO86_010893 [Hymenochirus boettgeri]
MLQREETAKHERSDNTADGRFQLQRTLGFFDSFCYLAGTIVGAGIFISPMGVLQYAQLNVGVALCIWAASGVVSMMCSLCYAELGSAFPYTGGEYYHVKRGLGPLPAFIFIWTLILFILPAAHAARALAFAEYTLRPVFFGCPVPDLVRKIVAIAVLWLLGIINSRSVKMSTWVQNIFTVLKLLALLIIIICGLRELGISRETPGYFKHAFSGQVPNAAQIAESFSRVYMHIKCRFCGDCLLFAGNISYLTVLTPKEIVSSAAVSVTWAYRVIPTVSWIIPASVAISIFGSLNGGILIVLRYREPDIHRPYKVFFPIAFGVVAVSAFLFSSDFTVTKSAIFLCLLFMLSTC